MTTIAPFFNLMNCTPIADQLSSPLNPVSVVNPLCIILVKNGSKGDRLLFRYPYTKKSRGKKSTSSSGGGSSKKTGGAAGGGSKNASFASSITTTTGSGHSGPEAASTPGRDGGEKTNAVSPPSGGSNKNEEVSEKSSPDKAEEGGSNGSTSDNADKDKSGGTDTDNDVVDGGSKADSTETTTPVISPVLPPPTTTVSKASPAPTFIGTTTKSLFDTPLSAISGKSFGSAGNANLTPDFGVARLRKVSRTTAPIISRGDGENPYSVSKNPTDDLFTEPSFANSTSDGRKFSLDGSEMLSQLSDKDLSNLLAVNSDLAERKFELKLNFVRFVGHPTLMHNPKDVRPINPDFQTSVKIFHIVFCLNAAASHSIVKCFFDLSKRLGIGLRHEEYRCGFMNKEMRKIIATHDEACTLSTEHMEGTEDHDNVQEKVFDDILAKSKLAQLMKRIYDDVCHSGFTFRRINNWVQISFCLPQRVHTHSFRSHAALVEPETIHRCLEAIRPYHAILLLVEPDALVSRFWLDSSSTIPRLLQVYSPLKSLQTLAADADLTLSQVVEIASHLVYWAHATVIYPLCESNIYFLAPDVPLDSNELEGAFRRKFPQLSMTQVFSDFSLAIPLGERFNPMLGGTYIQSQLVDLVTWMLQRRLLIQLHIYIYMATYLDGGSGGENQLDQISVNVDPDISLNLNSMRPFDFPEEDDATVSDTYSETTVDEIGLVNPIPLIQKDPTSEEVNELKPKSEESSSQQSEAQNQQDRAKQNNNNEEVVEPLDKFRSSLPELTNEAVKRAVGMVNKASISVQDIKMFSKIATYFTGEFHIEEIMYRENIRRSQLMLLLDKFRECLITVEKEDADISFFRNETVP